MTRVYRRWTDQEFAALRDLAAEGLNPTAIAYQMQREYGRPLAGTYHQIARLGGVEALRGERQFLVRSQRQVAELFGEDPKLVHIWITRGWLKADRYRPRRKTERRNGGPTKLISEFALLAFLAVPEAWPSYDPARIEDPDLRAEAERLRAEAGGGWVKVADLARQLHYTPWGLRRAWVAYPYERRVTQWRRDHYLWAPDVPAFVAWVRTPNRRRAA